MKMPVQRQNAGVATQPCNLTSVLPVIYSLFSGSVEVDSQMEGLEPGRVQLHELSLDQLGLHQGIAMSDGKEISCLQMQGSHSNLCKYTFSQAVYSKTICSRYFIIGFIFIYK